MPRILANPDTGVSNSNLRVNLFLISNSFDPSAISSWLTESVVIRSSGKEFEVTFGDGISDLYMVYTKRMKDGRIKVRSENQQYPDQRYILVLALHLVRQQ